MGPNISVRIRDRKGHTETQEKEGHVKTAAEIGVSSYKPRKARSYQKLEEAERTLPRASGGRVGLLTPQSGASDFLICEKINSYCSKASSLWLFVLAAPGN